MSELYYYYCKTDTFKSLLKSQSLWLTDLTKSNDAQEVVRTFKVLWNKVKALLAKTDLDKEMLNSQIEILDPTLECQVFSGIPYGCCFSSENDLVQQWNEYGDYGNGVAIGFDLSWFGIPNQMPITSASIMQSIGYEHVCYDCDDLCEAFVRLFYAEFKKHGNKAWIMSILPTLKHYSGFIKNPTFKDERETRIVYYPCSDCPDSLDGLSELITLPKPHFCLLWKKGAKHAMRSVTIGANCSLSEKDILASLNDVGIAGIEINHSECSYRQRL